MKKPHRPVYIRCALHVLRVPEIRQLLHAEQEHQYVLGLDVNLRLIVVHLVCVGSVDQAQGHARDIFRELIRHNCHSFVLVHNHPYGDVVSSKGDRAVTAWLRQCGEWLGIPLQAHVVVANGKQPREVGMPRKS
ncbi:MAG TPA: JAB domain-containing protein [Thauera aminoaromatica]|nr:JAB domain-containing protein [Thauera aminoaromatica]